MAQVYFRSWAANLLFSCVMTMQSLMAPRLPDYGELDRAPTEQREFSTTA